MKRNRGELGDSLRRDRGDGEEKEEEMARGGRKRRRREGGRGLWVDGCVLFFARRGFSLSGRGHP